MKRQITLQEYRSIDLTILMVVLAISQTLIHFAASVWFTDQLYVASPIAAVVALVMMRWGGWAAIHAIAGGAVFVLLANGSWQHYIIYGVGNACAMGALLMLKALGKERIRQDATLSLLFALCAQVLMWLGRAGLAWLLGFGGASLGFITTDVLSGVFALVIIWVSRRIDGLFEDQKHYLLRLESERQAERRDQF
jgi:hypothetical protein